MRLNKSALKRGDCFDILIKSAAVPTPGMPTPGMPTPAAVLPNPAAVLPNPAAVLPNPDQAALAARQLGAKVGRGIIIGGVASAPAIVGYLGGAKGVKPSTEADVQSGIGGLLLGASLARGGVKRVLAGAGIGTLGSIASNRLGLFMGSMKYKSDQENLPYYLKDNTQDYLKEYKLPLAFIAGAAAAQLTNKLVSTAHN